MRKLLIPVLITLTFLVLFLYSVNLEELLHDLRRIRTEEVIYAFSFYSLSQLVRSVRWKILLKELPLGRVLLINSANIFLNNVLPARTGELSWFYYAKRSGAELKVSLWAFLIGRLYDLFGLVSVFLLAYAFSRSILLPLSVLILLPILSLTLPYLRLFIPGIGKLEDLKDFLRRELTPSISLKLSLLSTVSFLLKALSIYVLVNPFLGFDLFKFSLAFSGGELTTILPIHGLFGYGTYEGGFLLPLKILGVELREGLKIGFIAHNFLLISSALWGIPSMFLMHTSSRKSP